MRIRKFSIALFMIGIIMMTPVLGFGSYAKADSGNSVTVNINGSPLQMDVPPTIIEGRTLVPLRAIFEALGAQVQWDAASQSITATKGNININLTIGSITATNNGTQITLDVPPQIIDGRTLVPARFVGEALGTQVQWDAANQAVDITTSGNIDSYKGDWSLVVTEDEKLYLFTCLKPYYGSTGINITDVNNNLVKGNIFSIQGAPSYRIATVDFEGQIENGTLSTSYKDEAWNYSGSLTINFANDKLVATITRDNTGTTSFWGIPEGVFPFVRPIDAKPVQITADEKDKLEKLLFPMAKDRIKPFEDGELTDEMIIKCIGVNIGAGFIDTSEFGDKVSTYGGNIIFDKSIMNDLAERYFGIGIKDNKSYDIAIYESGKYTVPALGGVSEYPIVQLMMKDNNNEGDFYAIVDYLFDSPTESNKFMYEYLVELKSADNNDYVIKAIDEIKDPINFGILNQFIQ